MMAEEFEPKIVQEASPLFTYYPPLIKELTEFWFQGVTQAIVTTSKAIIMPGEGSPSSNSSWSTSGSSPNVSRCPGFQRQKE